MPAHHSSDSKSKVRTNLIAQSTGEHRHTYAQVLIGWRGRMACEIESGQYELANGISVTVPCDEPHYYQGLTSDNELIVIDFANHDPLLDALEQTCEFPVRKALLSSAQCFTDTELLKPLMALAIGRLQNGNTLSSSLQCQLISLFVTQFCQYYQENSPPLDFNVRLDLQRLNNFIDGHPTTASTNKALADLFYISESHFYTLCRNQFNQTPQQYVLHRKLNSAKQLILERPRQPIHTLAHDLGFTHQSSFSRAYKQYFSESPMQTRKRHSGVK